MRWCGMDAGIPHTCCDLAVGRVEDVCELVVDSYVGRVEDAPPLPERRVPRTPAETGARRKAPRRAAAPT